MGWRHHRNRSIPYERSVAADRPIAWSSRRNTDTGSTTCPATSTSRYGSRSTPVDTRLAYFQMQRRVRDVTLHEDRSQVRVGNAPQVMATLRNTIISLHRRAGHTNIARACRRHAADPIHALNLILNT